MRCQRAERGTERGRALCTRGRAQVEQGFKEGETEVDISLKERLISQEERVANISLCTRFQGERESTHDMVRFKECTR